MYLHATKDLFSKKKKHAKLYYAFIAFCVNIFAKITVGTKTVIGF